MGDNPFPDKLGNKGEWRPATEANVLLNGYMLNTDEMVEEVHKFELKFTAENKRDEKKDLSAGPRNDVSRDLRHNLAWELYEKMLEQNAAWFKIEGKTDNFGFVYDRGINFYSLKKLDLTIKKNPNDPAVNKIEFDITKEGLSPDSTAYLLRMKNVKASLVYTEVVNLGAFRHDRLLNQSVAQFLDILSNQMILKAKGHFMFPSKMFDKSSIIPLTGVPHIMKLGMQKNVRFVGESLEKSSPIVQIDAKKSAFFPEIPPNPQNNKYQLADFAAKFLGITEPAHVWQYDNLTRLRKQIKGLVCLTTHLGERNTTVAIHGLTDVSAREKTFPWQDRGEVTIENYYRDQYNITLRHPQLPCVIERKPQNKESYYPLEVLVIVPGQRVSIQQQTPKLTEQMIRNCQAIPADFKKNTTEQKGKATIQNSNLFFRKFKVGVDNDMLEAKAQLLFPPAITYQAEQRVEPNNRGDYDNGWALRPNDNRRFISPINLDKNWAAIIVANEVSGNDCMRFLNIFVEQAKNRGLQLALPRITENAHNILPKTMNDIRDALKKAKINFLLFFTRDKINPAPHMAFKLMEAQTGIITQHVTGPILSKAIGQRGAIMVLDNLLMKFNAKNGGFAHGINAGRIFMNVNRRNDDVVAKEFLGKGRMFFGFEMSHAAPQTLYERQDPNVAVGDPSITGMAYTIGVGQNILDMRGTFWCQETRVTSIKYLQTPLVDALMKFKLKNKCFPKHLIVYRGGVSEGEFSKVAVDERQQFEAAFEKLQTDEKEFVAPALTIIVCQRGSNYRIVPSGNIDRQAKPAQQNCPRGTVVNGSVMHPTLTEFLMVGHTTIQGTAQPVRCTVVYDNAPEKRIDRIGLAELEYLTYTLCYAHGIVTLPVSVPAVLYSAGDLAKRGRANYKAVEDQERGNADFGKKEDGQSDEDYFANLSSRIGPTAEIDSKFWA